MHESRRDLKKIDIMRKKKNKKKTGDTYIHTCTDAPWGNEPKIRNLQALMVPFEDNKEKKKNFEISKSRKLIFSRTTEIKKLARFF